MKIPTPEEHLGDNCTNAKVNKILELFLREAKEASDNGDKEVFVNVWESDSSDDVAASKLIEKGWNIERCRAMLGWYIHL